MLPTMWTLLIHLPVGYLISITIWVLVLAVCPIVLVRLRRRWKSSARRMRILFAGLGIWFVLCPLTAIEIGFALLYDTTDSFSMTNVSRRWFEIHSIPDEKTLSFSDGTGITYRDSRAFPESTHLCLLGDSFTFGHGVADVENRFSNLLQRRISEDRTIESPMVVSNLSYPGTDLPWVETVLQRAFEDGRRIDHAVYVMCLNDIESFHDPRMTRSSELSHFDPPTFLLRETYFFNWAWFRVQQLSRSDVRDYYSFVREYYQGEPWQRFQLKIAQVHDLCRRNECRFSIVVFPFLHNLAQDYPFSEIHEQIVRDCEGLGIPTIDLRKPLAAAAGQGLTVNAFDAHPNELAHEIVADELQHLLP